MDSCYMSEQSSPDNLTDYPSIYPQLGSTTSPPSASPICSSAYSLQYFSFFMLLQLWSRIIIIVQQTTINMNADQFHTDFCPSCGALVELQTIADSVSCQICQSKRSFQEFAGKIMKTQLHIRKDKQWLLKYEGKKMREKRGLSRMTTKMKCPQCNNPELKYYIKQIRSVDEGSTVFYNCQKCGHNYSVNN